MKYLQLPAAVVQEFRCTFWIAPRLPPKCLLVNRNLADAPLIAVMRAQHMVSRFSH